jgi:hypothetical protein
MNHDDMKESLTDLIMNNKEIIKLTEISKKEIIENIDKYLEEQGYEEMNEEEWYEYYLLEDEIEILKSLNELNTKRLEEKKKKQKMAAIIISLNKTVQYDIIENFTNTINNL